MRLKIERSETLLIVGLCIVCGQTCHWLLITEQYSPTTYGPCCCCCCWCWCERRVADTTQWWNDAHLKRWHIAAEVGGAQKCRPLKVRWHGARSLFIRTLEWHIHRWDYVGSVGWVGLNSHNMKDVTKLVDLAL